MSLSGWMALSRWMTLTGWMALSVWMAVLRVDGALKVDAWRSQCGMALSVWIRADVRVRVDGVGRVGVDGAMCPEWIVWVEWMVGQSGWVLVTVMVHIRVDGDMGWIRVVKSGWCG